MKTVVRLMEYNLLQFFNMPKLIRIKKYIEVYAKIINIMII